MWRISGRRIVLLASFCLLALVRAEAQAPPPHPANAQTFRMRGRVVDAFTGQPLSHVVVMTGPADVPPPGATVLTAEDGRFEFAGLKAGKYWLTAERPGYGRQNLDEHEQFSSAVAVGPDRASSEVVFRLRPDASITGTVSDEAGDPVRDAQVLLLQDALTEGRRATLQRDQRMTDDEGRYRFPHLNPGRFFVVVVTTPWYTRQPEPSRHKEAQPREPSPLDVTYPVTFYPGATEEKAATPIELKPGDQASADIALAAVPAIHFAVRQETGSLESLNVVVMKRIFDGPAVALGGEVSRENGELEIGGLAEGEYDVLMRDANQPSRRLQRMNVTANAEISTSQGAAVPAITGTLTVDGAPATAPTVVQLRDNNSGQTMMAVAGAQGEMIFDSEPAGAGNYVVSTANLPKAAIRSVSAEGAKVNGRTVLITGANPVKLKIEATRSVGEVDGTALRNGKPVAGAMVVLVPRDLTDTSLFRRDQSDSDGTFTLRDILPGSYSVIAISDWDAEWLNPLMLKPYLKQAQSVEVSAGRPAHANVKVQ